MCRKTEPRRALFPVFQLLSHRATGAWGVGLFSCCLAYVEQSSQVETSGINQVEIHFFRWNFLVGTLHLRAKKSFLAK